MQCWISEPSTLGSLLPKRNDSHSTRKERPEYKLVNSAVLLMRPSQEYLRESEPTLEKKVIFHVTFIYQLVLFYLEALKFWCPNFIFFSRSAFGGERDLHSLNLSQGSSIFVFGWFLVMSISHFLLDVQRSNSSGVKFEGWSRPLHGCIPVDGC